MDPPPLGFERPDRPTAALLTLAQEQVMLAASLLGDVVARPVTAAHELERHLDDLHQTASALSEALGRSRRYGERRASILAWQAANGDVADAIVQVARAYVAADDSRFAGVVLAARDEARACLDPHGSLADVAARCNERRRDLRAEAREARRWALAVQADPWVAVATLELLRRVEDLEQRCGMVCRRAESHPALSA